MARAIDLIVESVPFSVAHCLQVTREPRLVLGLVNVTNVVFLIIRDGGGAIVVDCGVYDVHVLVW